MKSCCYSRLAPPQSAEATAARFGAALRDVSVIVIGPLFL